MLSRVSSTPVTVTVWLVFQFDVVKLTVAGSTVAAVLSAVATDTAPVGWLDSATV